MISVKEGSLYAFLTPETAEELHTIKSCLTFVKKVKAYSKRPIETRTYLYHRRGNTILVFKGIVEEAVEKLKKAGCEVSYTPNGSFWKPPEDTLKNEAIKNLRPYQVDAFNAVVASSGGILWLATNAGKTEVAGAIIKAYPKQRFLYLVRNKELLEQTVERFKDKFGIDVGEISTRRQETDKKATIAMAQTVYSRLDDFTDFLITVDALICDECQHFGGDSAEAVISKCTGASFRMGMTGTVPSDEATRLTIQRFFGPVSYRIPNSYLIENQFSSPIQIQMVHGDWGNTGVGAEVRRIVVMDSYGGSGANLWHEACMMGIVCNDQRNAAVNTIIKNIIYNKGDGIIVFVDYIEHGERLADITGLPFVHASSEDRADLFQNFKSGALPGIITSPIMNEGISIDRIKHVILAGGSKSEIKLLQRIGRGLRKDTDKRLVTVYDFYDNEIPMLERHTTKRLAIYTTEGFPVQDRKLVDFTLAE